MDIIGVGITTGDWRGDVCCSSVDHAGDRGRMIQRKSMTNRNTY